MTKDQDYKGMPDHPICKPWNLFALRLLNRYMAAKYIFIPAVIGIVAIITARNTIGLQKIKFPAFNISFRLRGQVPFFKLGLW
jgi:hypothetical protein